MLQQSCVAANPVLTRISNEAAKSGVYKNAVTHSSAVLNYLEALSENKEGSLFAKAEESENTDEVITKIGSMAISYNKMIDSLKEEGGKTNQAYLKSLYCALSESNESLEKIGLSVKADGWNRPAEIISESDDAYKYQNCKYGVRGNPERPIAAIVHTANGKSIELYTSKKNDATLSFIYVQVPSITTEHKISLPSVLKDSILYMAGYLTCISLGDTDTASGFLGVARKLAHIVEPTETS